MHFLILTKVIHTNKLFGAFMKKPQESWKSVLAEIEIETSRATFVMFFKNTSLLSVENNVATIAAPSTMIIDLIQKRFFKLLEGAAKKHISKDIKIIFVPKSQEEEGQMSKESSPLFFEPQKPSVPEILPRIRPDYTFDNMAVSSSNQLAYASAISVSKKPRKPR